MEWCHDLEQEPAARLRLVSREELQWQPHPDSNSVGVTVWHVSRWLDVLGSRTFTGLPARDELWHAEGWQEATGYDPSGLGFLGLGTLTGYTPEQMRAVPVMDTGALSSYLSQSACRLVAQIASLGSSRLQVAGPQGLSPYQLIWQHPAGLVRTRRRDRHPHRTPRANPPCGLQAALRPTPSP